MERFAHDYLPTLKPMTQVRYRTSFRQLAPTFTNLYLDEITRGRLADYASARMKGGTKGATVRRDLAALSCLCSCAVAWDYIDANPVKQFSKRHIRESAPRTTYPTTEQVDRLVNHASPMAGRIIRFLAETGMRQEEVCRLEWSQVSIQRREVRLTKTKTSSPRVVLLSDAAPGTLVGTPRHITASAVFWHGDGQRYANFAGAFRKIARRAAVPLFAQHTGDLAALQAILGHKTVTMTMRYSHLMTDHLHRDMNKYGAAVGTVPGTGASDLAGKSSSDAI